MTPQNFNLDYQEVLIKINQQEQLVSWHVFSRLKPTKGLVVQFHGNAENQSSHMPSLLWLVDYGYDVITFDYRGFGKSSGTSSFPTLKEDVNKIFSFVKQLKKPNQQLIFVGQSLGGYLLLQTLANSEIEQDIDLLILDSSFYSVKSMLRSKSKILSWFSPSEKAFIKPTIKKILITHGTKDPVIAFSNGERLREVFPESLWWKIEEGRHLDVFTAHDFKYRSLLLNLLGHEKPYQVESYELNEMDKTYLKTRTSKTKNLVGLNEKLEMYKKDFISHPSSKKVPLTCPTRCLCPLYSELFQRLGSKKLAQSMYRQGLSNQQQIDQKCFSEAETF